MQAIHIKKNSFWKSLLFNIGGFFVLLSLLGVVYYRMFDWLFEDLLVFAKLKRRPATGRAIWIWK